MSIEWQVVVHYQSVSEAATICKLTAQIHKSSGEVVRKKPRCLTKQTSGLVEIEVQRPVCMELYKDYRELGRFMLRAGGTTIAAGVVTKVFIFTRFTFLFNKNKKRVTKCCFSFFPQIF